MKKLIKVLTAGILMLCLIGTAWAQVTPIKDIQYTEDASGDSPLSGETVTISGVVTAEGYAFGGSFYFVADSSGPWNGIKVYDRNEAAQGDWVTLTGTVSEYYGCTQISDVTEFNVDTLQSLEIQPAVVTTQEVGTGGSLAEACEGCLVQVRDVDITNPDLGYGEYQVDDGSGPCVVDDAADYYFDPAEYTSAKSITGVLEYSFGDTKIQPRLALDVVEDGSYTRIQRIQQVRYSDLLKAPQDQASDSSYLSTDTVSVHGIVTMPAGLSYAGDGIKFIVSEPEGGPWSAILSYAEDSTAVPILLEGDEIEMTGYIEEYQSGESQMTEIFNISTINVLSIGNDLPEPDSIKTGDLRWPTSAEQWGNVMVQVNQAQITTHQNSYNELFKVDDGTGEVIVDADSDSLQSAYFPDDGNGKPRPPIGTIAEKIRGWVYHHFGSYADSSTYKLEPLYLSDMVWSAGPPTVSNTRRDAAYVGTYTPVNVTTKVETNLNLASVSLNYKIDDGEYSSVEMSDNDDGTFTGAIPGIATNDVLVSYFVKAEDEEGQTTVDPVDTTQTHYAYVVKDGALSISDVQTTPWPQGDSPFHGYNVELSGVVTVDTTFYNKFEAYAMQDASGPWNGIFLFGDFTALFPGYEIKVYGKVSDYNPDWLFKWGNNTVVLVDSFDVLGDGATVPAPEVVTTGVLGNEEESNAEAYEGSLVRVENPVITSFNGYDISVDDGTGECLIDADGWAGADQDENPFFYFNTDDEYLVVGGTDTLRIGDQFTYVQGPFIYSFGTYKIEIRGFQDLGGIEVGVESDVQATPLSYKLDQNFPNPFNPETKIYFEIPQSERVQVAVYNVLGRHVKTLTNTEFSSGRHVLNWDGTDKTGNRVGSGVYIYRIKAGDFVSHKKMMMIK
ncbi:MAG: T9SS type A sorting domain-containing protein [candidate division KSB1 bacterium]|nr:T9SS type A sorting domain-containing protein [candidate division KSB1 bacterium]